MKKELNELTEALRAVSSMVLIQHISPDGDTCGSALALRRALLSLGKRVTVICDDPVPMIYLDLDGAREVMTPEQVAGQTFDLALAVDVGDLGRMGKCTSIFESAPRTAQIDHHGTNPRYAGTNYVRSPVSATGVLALEVIDALHVPLDPETAKCLYAAVATDTGNFKQNNTDAEALQVAVRCVQAGFEPAELLRRVFDLRPVGQVRLIARALSSLTLYADERLAMMQLLTEDFAEAGALPEHTEGIINFAINAEGVRIACLLSQHGERVKCSLRSMPPYDVARVVVAFGGGGHALAAGCMMRGPMAEARERMLRALLAELERVP